ncbi:MAG: hypothetical protein GWN58_08155 [Anaerolineae bacterium]|nr:hypothetical protein [Anaerolineae bacterium]
MVDLHPHIAISVPDLESAEKYYRQLFHMRVVTREAMTPEGDAQLPYDKTWADAKAAGIDLYMLALRRDEFVLALFAEDAIAAMGFSPPARPLFVGLRMKESEIDEIRARLGPEDTWNEHNRGFTDRYGIVWQMRSEGEFVGNGESQGRWLEL